MNTIPNTSADNIDTAVRRMHLLQGVSIQEIARRWQLSENQVKKIIKHAEKMDVRNAEQEERDQRDARIRDLKDKGKTHRVIARTVGCSLATVDRAIHKRPRKKVKAQTGVTSTNAPAPVPAPQPPKQVQIPKSTEDFTFTFTIGNETYTFSRNSKQ